MYDILACIIITLIGLFFIIKPDIVWKLKHFMNTESGAPSDYFLSYTRNLGIIITVVGIIITIVLIIY